MPFHPETVTLHISSDAGNAYKLEVKRLTWGVMQEALDRDILSNVTDSIRILSEQVVAVRCNDELINLTDVPSHVMTAALDAHPDFGRNSDENENSSENSASTTAMEPSTLI